MFVEETKKILIIDDNEDIHKDFIKILKSSSQEKALEEDEAILFNQEIGSTSKSKLDYIVESAYQGKDGLELVKRAFEKGEPYALAFVDMLMPPGWNGIETIKEIWKVDTNIQIVICSAYSDYSWEDITRELGSSENLLILKKPFEIIEICQLAAALCKKWELRKQVQYQIENLQSLVKARTADLESALSLVNATLESTGEGIVVVSRDRKIVLFNKNFISSWNLSEEILAKYDTETIFQKMGENIADPAMFYQIMTDFEKSADNTSTKELKLNSGKILELYKNPQILNNEIIGTVLSFRDVTERHSLQEQLLYQATHDSLTDLTNRILLSDRVEQALEYAKRYGMFVGFLLFDLDNFKQINDSYGHSVGDGLLKEVARRLKSSVRKVDTVTRLGGDEFVILLAPQPNTDFIESIVKRVYSSLSHPYKIEGHDLSVTASVGISIYPKDGFTYDLLLKNADISLYKSKEMGRNTYQFFMPEFNENLVRNAQLSSDIHYALEREELVLHYQPLVDLNSNKIIGTEVLLRWQHPSLGMIDPHTVITLAEKTGLIIPMGEWILKTACLQNKMWQELYAPELCIAVNISWYQFRKRSFVETIARILKETNLSPSFLELEITEGILISNLNEFMEKMFELKKLGVHLAIDDFGTGYSNLGYLKYLPFDKVKIDKIFIDEISAENNDDCIVEAIISMSKKMGLTVVAEGVERPEQLNYLRRNHSDQVQGFYFSKPLTEQECSEFIKNWPQSMAQIITLDVGDKKGNSKKIA